MSKLDKVLVAKLAFLSDMYTIRCTCLRAADFRFPARPPGRRARGGGGRGRAAGRACPRRPSRPDFSYKAV